MQLEKILHAKFQFPSFRTGQREIIEDILGGRNVVAMLPTGAGKSVCYQLPGYILSGTVLIVSPLLSLMEDQVQQLKSRGEKKVVGLNSFLSYQKRVEVLKALHQYRFIYASPEILQSKEVIAALQTINISLFVIDEAHCISQWGHEFRTDYLKLDNVRKIIGNPPCLALTATATKEVIDDIILHLHINDAVKHIYSIDRPNIAISVKKVTSLPDKIAETIEYVKKLQGPGIIYFSSRSWAEMMTAYLRENGIERTAYYHGGLENDNRLLIQQQFIHNQLDVICCTNAFGMGIDKSNVRFIIHFHYPSQFESYLQEIGRAGRDGNTSIAILLYSKEDHELNQGMIQLDLPNQNDWDLLFTLLTNPNKKPILNEIETLMVENYGISQVKWRYMKYQLEIHHVLSHNGNISQSGLSEQVKMKLIASVKDRLRLKQRNLAQFKRWLSAENCCRRDSLLRKFNQEITINPVQCCDYCGLEMDHYFKTTDQTEASHFLNWEDDLKKIFKQSGER